MVTLERSRDVSYEELRRQFGLATGDADRFSNIEVITDDDQDKLTELGKMHENDYVVPYGTIFWNSPRGQKISENLYRSHMDRKRLSEIAWRRVERLVGRTSLIVPKSLRVIMAASLNCEMAECWRETPSNLADALKILVSEHSTIETIPLCLVSVKGFQTLYVLKA